MNFLNIRPESELRRPEELSLYSVDLSDNCGAKREPESTGFAGFSEARGLIGAGEVGDTGVAPEPPEPLDFPDTSECGSETSE